MKYFEVTFQINSDFEFINDVLSSKLGEIGFESFMEQGDALLAYIPQNQYNSKLIDEIIANFPIEGCFNYSVKEMEDKDWNEEWEKNFFQPIIIDNKCVIRSSFHQGTPKLDYEIIINPQMAFGTGHHETTSSVISHLLEIDMNGKTVLDMGCGTSICSIICWQDVGPLSKWVKVVRSLTSQKKKSSMLPSLSLPLPSRSASSPDWRKSCRCASG